MDKALFSYFVEEWKIFLVTTNKLLFFMGDILKGIGISPNVFCSLLNLLFFLPWDHVNLSIGACL